MNIQELFQYTEGPWHWQKLGKVYTLVALKSKEVILASADLKANMFGSTPHPELVMQKDGELLRIDPLHPNAKLLQAAPLLLQAALDAEALLLLATEDPATSQALRDACLKKLQESIRKALV